MTFCGVIINVSEYYFNPHSHEGSDRRIKKRRNDWKISIHTPTKGVTSTRPTTESSTIISIHTPTKGVTLPRHWLRWNQTDFNPHSHEGSDVWRGAYICFYIYFNPHSHEGSDCIRQRRLRRSVFNFNPHSHEGSDSKDWQRHRQPGNFNPHSHEGSDSIVWSVRSMRRDFNPHSHEGSDASDLISLVDSVISIHTPTKGVTQRRQWMSHSWEQFQSTLPRREWRFATTQEMLEDTISIHTPTKGVTLSIGRCL